ncbi:MAG: hypothetical protein N3G19_02645 [Candidatus Pacearchaeota archaeon]|nr:hypothetical protein [Candidatus Pacearchaeota archaeon]
MWNEIEQEKRIADHLFYVSLKYAKTTDVIINLLIRWESLLNKCMELMLKRAKKNKEIKEIPSAPKAKELAIREIYGNETVQKVMDLYSLFRKVLETEKIREHEFRKNVALRLINTPLDKEIVINMEKLKEWNSLLENFISYVRHIEGK